MLDLGVWKANESISLAGELIGRRADSSIHPQDQFEPALLQENNMERRRYDGSCWLCSGFGARNA